MVRFGRNNRYSNRYDDEVSFSRENGFHMLQLWYDKFGLCQNKQERGNLKIIKSADHPVIVHALIDIGEFDTLIDELLPILDELDQNELIIHPMCKSEPINDDTFHILSDKICEAENRLRIEGVAVYVENNSQLSPVFNRPEEFEYLFRANDNLKFLLDIAHLNDYEHLGKLAAVKFPELLHIADRNLENIHEHLPIGEGNIDFKYVFDSVLKGFKGTIIFELMYPDKEVIESKKRIEKIIEGGSYES